MSYTNNATLENGYTTESDQAAIVESGPFDVNAMSQRKQMHARGIDQHVAYPGCEDINLSIQEGELLFSEKCAHAAQSGGQRISVMSSFNGHIVKAPTIEAEMRRFFFCGISTSTYNMPGDTRTSRGGPNNNTETGVAWISSGAKSAYKNTGNMRIPAGSLVCAVFPSIASMRRNPSSSGSIYISPNNGGGGQPLGKFVLVTIPFDPEDYSLQLQTAHALLRVQKSNVPTAGILDLPFEQLFEAEHRRKTSDAQQESGLMTAAVLASGFIMLQTLKTSSNVNVQTALREVMNAGNPAEVQEKMIALADTMGVFKTTQQAKDPTLEIMDNVMMHHCAHASKREAVLLAFKKRHAKAFANDKLKPLYEVNNDIRYARLLNDPIGNFYSAVGSAAYNKSAWIIGRCMHDCQPGMVLDLSLRAGTKVCCK